MAEDEIIKHTKAVYKTWKDSHTGAWHKFKEIFVEIVIIVFAVSISIWFHNWSEGLKDRQEEKEFLAGLKVDLQGDIVQMQGDRNAYINTLSGIRYYLKVQQGRTPLRDDSLAKYSQVLFSTTQLVPNTSRFDALKSSGRLSIIENKELLKNILDLYQGDIAEILILNNGYNDFKTNHLGAFLDDNLILDSLNRPVNLQKIFSIPKVHIYLIKGLGAQQNIDQYQCY